MILLRVMILAIAQELAELQPVSSSTHVVIAEKLMGLDPSSPPLTLLLIVLHTGTMFAVIVYFRRQLKRHISRARFPLGASGHILFSRIYLTVAPSSLTV